VIDLSPLTADAFGDNGDRVRQIVTAAAALPDHVPMLLLPVRIETRFTQVEQVVPTPTTLRDLERRLRDAAGVLQAIAALNFHTELVGTARVRREFKATVEVPLYAFVEARLSDVHAAMGAAALLIRDHLDGSGADRESAAVAAQAVADGFKPAITAVRALRSEFQATRLIAAIRAEEAHAAPILHAITRRTLAAARLRAELDAPDVRTIAARLERERPGHVLGGTRPGPRPRVVAGSRAEVAGLNLRTGIATVAHARLAQDAATFDDLTARVRTLSHARDVPPLVEAAGTIALLPAKWKRELASAVDAARSRVPEAAALAAAVAAIRSDDEGLDATVPRHDIVVALPRATRIVDELHVRIYPDDVFVDTHEEPLTAAERAAGVAYWGEALRSTLEPAQRAAWRGLCAGRDTRRAAWIAERTRPAAPPAPTPGTVAGDALLREIRTFSRRVDEVSGSRPGDRLQAILRAAEAVADALVRVPPLPAAVVERAREQMRVMGGRIDQIVTRATDRITAAELRTWSRRIQRQLELIDRRLSRVRIEPPPGLPAVDAAPLKSGAWTRAARSDVLPSRFCVIAVSRGRVAHVVAGAPIPADLKLSIDPSPADPAAEEFRLDADGRLVVGTSIRWMTDYDQAVTKGMAVSIPITADEAEVGFDRLYVIGISGDDAAAGADRLEALVENHHYGATGLGIVPVGTATNNTEQQAAGFSSADDADASFPIERSRPLIDSAAPDENAADGLRLARALGIDPAQFAHVAGADGHGGSEALAVNAALYGATLGNALEELAAPVISLDSRDRLRGFALAHVTARGLIPTLRVGAQPYGILPTTAYTRYEPASDETLPPGTLAAAMVSQNRFDRLLAHVLVQMADDWTRLRDAASAPPPSAIPAAQAQFLGLLGLEATSTSAAYRFGLNVASRQGIRDDAAEFGSRALLERFEATLRDAFGIAPGPLFQEGRVAEAMKDVAQRLDDARAFDLRLLKKLHPITGPVVGATHTADLTSLLASTPVQLFNEAAGDEQGRPLVYLLVRQALLVELMDAALRILSVEGLMDEERRVMAGASATYLRQSLTSQQAVTRWSYLFASLPMLYGQGNAPLFAHLGAQRMAAYLASRGDNNLFRSFAGRAAHEPFVQALQRHAIAVRSLTTIPAERLTPLVMEHLDLATNRLDAWLTGLAQRRLTALRNATPRGVYVGAYGWVEDLRPDRGHPLAGDVPAALAGDPSVPIHRDPESQGFIQTPSLNHAATAAILRSGYLAQRAEGDVENRMAVNLSSRRVRAALGVMDGVRAGNDLGALLGYRLERYLHDAYATSGPLDDVIAPLRRAFPTVGRVDASAGGADTAAARQVCDGLAILATVHAWIRANAGDRAAQLTVYDVLVDEGRYTGYPWGLGSNVLPATTDAVRLQGVLRAIDHVADALDAVGDLTLAEAVHQIAVGNHPRAAAALGALAEGKAPPEPEVVRTPRTGTPVTHRLLLALSDAAGAPAGWNAIALTPRALAEPALNRLAGALLGPPDQIRLRLVRAEGGAHAGNVELPDLHLQPIDLVAVLGAGLEKGLGEIATRALDAKRPADLNDSAPPPRLQLDLTRAPSWAPNVRTLTEVAPLLEAIGAMIGRARPATAHDYILGETRPAGSGSGVDQDELETRTRAARQALEDAAVTLARLLADDATVNAADFTGNVGAFLVAHVAVAPRWADREAWRAALMALAAFGLPSAAPPTQFTSREAVLTLLRDAAATTLVEVVPRLTGASATLARPLTVASLTETMKTIFGDAFVVVPNVTLRNGPEIIGAFAATIASPATIDGWLQGAAAVRESAAHLAAVMALADAQGTPTPLAQVAQLPTVAGDVWLGGPTPAAAGRAGRLSLVIFGAGDLAAAGAGASLFLDEWTEIIPSTSETTGLAIHYDQPDATPPQCLLLAVPPARRGRWRFGDLVQTLHETFELAKNRTVELDDLRTEVYGQLLPLIVGELVPEMIASQTASADGDRVILDFAHNNP